MLYVFIPGESAAKIGHCSCFAQIYLRVAVGVPVGNTDGFHVVIVEEDQIRAALFSERRNNTAEIRLVCAEAPFRGKGYASSLVCAYHKAWIGGVKRFFQWLDASNGDAAALYRSFGYEFDRRKAMEYIIR